ncbi:hypothetical protein ACFV9C_23320 [Kribbella sp. NPDC059898]|uniref:hypothetical protein n=1 Tax=Kribbella sp. NPDC059898 TaxID=3346995 RepID=UPI0036611AC7
MSGAWPPPSGVKAHVAEYGTVVLTAWCGSCTAENRSHRERLGDVVIAPSGVKMWITTDRRRGMRLPNVQVLSHPALSNPAIPETLSAFCHHHGSGSVATTDVLTARGTVVLNLNAPA